MIGESGQPIHRHERALFAIALAPGTNHRNQLARREWREQHRIGTLMVNLGTDLSKQYHRQNRGPINLTNHRHHLDVGTPRQRVGHQNEVCIGFAQQRWHLRGVEHHGHPHSRIAQYPGVLFCAFRNRINHDYPIRFRDDNIRQPVQPFNQVSDANWLGEVIAPARTNGLEPCRQIAASGHEYYRHTAALHRIRRNDRARTSEISLFKHNVHDDCCRTTVLHGRLEQTGRAKGLHIEAEKSELQLQGARQFQIIVEKID